MPSWQTRWLPVSCRKCSSPMTAMCFDAWMAGAQVEGQTTVLWEILRENRTHTQREIYIYILYVNNLNVFLEILILRGESQHVLPCGGPGWAVWTWEDVFSGSITWWSSACSCSKRFYGRPLCRKNRGQYCQNFTPCNNSFRRLPMHQCAGFENLNAPRGSATILPQGRCLQNVGVWLLRHAQGTQLVREDQRAILYRLLSTYVYPSPEQAPPNSKTDALIIPAWILCRGWGI